MKFIYFENLKALKTKAGFTNQEISNLSGVPVATVNRIFQAEMKNPSLLPIAEIVRVCGGSLDEVMEIRKPAGPECAGDQCPRLQELKVSDKRHFVVAAALTGGILLSFLFDALHPLLGYIQW